MQVPFVLIVIQYKTLQTHVQAHLFRTRLLMQGHVARIAMLDVIRPVILLRQYAESIASI